VTPNWDISIYLKAGNQFFSVWLFELVDKIKDRNDPAYVVEAPQLRYVPEVNLHTFQTFAVDLKAPKQAVFVVHRSFFEDETIVFRHGMGGLFSITNKVVNDEGMLVVVNKEEFPVSDLDATLTEGILEPILFASPPTFIDVQFELYQFRNRLAQHFVDTLSGGSRKRSFRFETFCSVEHFYILLLQKPNPHVENKHRGLVGGAMLTHDSIFKVRSPCNEATIEFESVDLLFNFLGSFFYFWPLTSSKNYTTGGFKDFQFIALDRFEPNLKFVYDYRHRKLRVCGELKVVTFDTAFGAEAQSSTMIQSLADRLCDDVAFTDEESGQQYVVISVERNADPDLVKKGKPHLQFNGIVAWVLPIDGSKWKQKLTATCRSDDVWKYRECIPMDPSDFDVDRHIIPFVPSSTPAKKKVKKDPDELSPDKIWKPSKQSDRTERGMRDSLAVKEFFMSRLQDCELKEMPCHACMWLFKSLNNACLAHRTDFRLAMETSLEWASIPDIVRAISFVLAMDIVMPTEKCTNKDVFLKKCISECLDVAEKFEYKH